MRFPRYSLKYFKTNFRNNAKHIANLQKQRKKAGHITIPSRQNILYDITKHCDNKLQAI